MARRFNTRRVATGTIGCFAHRRAYPNREPRMPHLMINGQRHDLPTHTLEEPLLWLLRETLGLVGTKYGCGQAACGACTVMLGDQAVRSCVTPCAAAVGTPVTTVEGLGRSDALHPLQQTWITLRVPQCGYCQAASWSARRRGGAAAPCAAADGRAGARGARPSPVPMRGTYDRIVAAVLHAAEGCPSSTAAACR
jgi:nicotinate dehydrogenase subunit A